ncbi:MAG: hypothetical protein MUF58_02950 [Arcicella sp.]|jgi:hypothetical protein|nr:hypothetical protein [Arcicella sp.]
MKIAQKTALLLSLFVLVSSLTYAQESLSNKEILHLQASKISQDIILAKISASKCQFDLTAQGLIDLKAGKISDKVVRAMFLASPPMETMTNQDVIKLSESDISTALLKEKISKTPHQFTVDSESLIKLKAAKVNDGVVKEMIMNPTQGGTPILSAALKPSSTATSVPVATSSTTPTTSSVKSNVSTVSWEQVIVTNAFEEVKGLTRVGEISASASRAYGKEERLRKEAIEKLKKEAASKGATHVLLQSNSFAPTPFNTVSLGGVCYKK